MNISKIFVVAALLMVSTSSVHANITVNFLEAAPKDRFVITNTGQCSLLALRVDIDLTDTAGGLIFDTTAAGAGVDVFQPFEVSSGEIRLNSEAQINDGDKFLSVIISKIQARASVSFTIDVDDTLANSERGMIIVSDAEIEGGRVTVLHGSLDNYGTFGRNSIALINMPTCA
jgi:hypothetical protein